jgi:hypothetical protein
MGAAVYAGPTNSVVIDRQGMFWLAGKWKNSGDGSAGQPYSTFRYLQDIQTCKMTHAALGGVTLFALAAEDDGGVMTIGWGQNAANGMSRDHMSVVILWKHNIDKKSILQANSDWVQISRRAQRSHSKMSRWLESMYLGAYLIYFHCFFPSLL